MRYIDAILGNLRSAGFSIENATHAFWHLDSYVYGHVVQETSLPLGTAEQTTSAERARDEITMDAFPHLFEVERHASNSNYSFDFEFEFGLDLILDGLEILLDQTARG